jgi:hypothetical protein
MHDDMIDPAAGPAMHAAPPALAFAPDVDHHPPTLDMPTSRTRETAERAAEAALRPVAGVEELQVVGAIHDRVLDQLGILTSARSVWLHPDVVRRLGRRRGAAPGDVEFVLARMARTILRPAWVGRDRRAGRVYLVSARDDGAAARDDGAAERSLCVVVRFAAGPRSLSGLDEIWVGGAFPIGRRSLTRLAKRDRLMAVEWAADD